MATRSWARLRTRSGSSDQHVGVGRHQVDEQLHLVDERPAPATPCPRRRCPAAILSVSSASCGWASPERGRAAAYVVGQQQLAARRRPQPVDLLEGALVGDRERRGSPRPRRPRTPPAAGAPRSAGRRRRCRRGPRTRRASRPGRPGCTPRPRGGVRRRRARPSSPGASSTGSRSPRPADLRLQHRADRRDHDPERAGGRRRRRGGAAGAARPAGGRRCRCAG